MSARLEIGGATVRFGATVALDHVDLVVEPGEVVAVVGPSGCGKSTLLRAVAGLQPLDHGTVHLDGRDLAGVPVHRRGVGLMFQEHALFPHRDVAGNVGFGLRMQGRPAREVATRVDELLELVGLRGTAHRSVRSLSGGEQQRVALARALAPDPSVLLLDEALGALDRTLRDRLVAELRALFTDLGRTVVAVTHDQHEAFALADRVAVLDGGRLLQVGSPAALWGQPASARVARLLGLPNVVAVDVIAGVARSPWGPVPLDGPDGAAVLLVRPDAVRLGAGGTTDAIAGTVRFQGSRSIVELGIPGAPPLEAEVATAEAPHPGDLVQVALDARSVVRLPPDSDPG